MPIADFLTSEGSNPLKIMCLGDSITLGTDATSTWLPKNGYRYRLWYHLRRAGQAVTMVGPFADGGTYAAWSSAHAGIGGTTLTTMNSNVAGWIAAHEPDVVLLIGGINDIALGASPATAITRLETLIDTIQATPTAPDIIVSTTTLHSSYLTDSVTYNGLLSAACAGKAVRFVDAAGDISAANSMLSDAVHPRPRGYERIAARMATAVLGLLDGSYIHYRMTSAGTSEDDVLRTCHGTYGGTPVFNGDSVTFDGIADELIGDEIVFMPDTYSVLMKVENWGNSSNAAFWSLRDGATTDYHALYVPGSGSGRLAAVWDGVSNHSLAWIPVALQDYHVALTRDGTSVRVYIDGVEDASSPLTLPAVVLDNALLELMSTGGAQFASGDVLDFQIKHRVLSAVEIAAAAAA